MRQYWVVLSLLIQVGIMTGGLLYWSQAFSFHSTIKTEYMYSFRTEQDSNSCRCSVLQKMYHLPKGPSKRGGRADEHYFVHTYEVCFDVHGQEWRYDSSAVSHNAWFSSLDFFSFLHQLLSLLKNPFHLHPWNTRPLNYLFPMMSQLKGCNNN